MSSHFGWLDFAEDDRQKMLDLVKLFHEQDTRDERYRFNSTLLQITFFQALAQFKPEHVICFLFPCYTKNWKKRNFIGKNRTAHARTACTSHSQDI